MLRRFAALFVAAVLASPAVAADDLLNLMPRQGGFVLVVESPRAMADTAAAVKTLQNALNLPQIRTLLDAPGVKRSALLLAHVESELVAKWPELLEKLAGGGIALG